MGWQCRAVSGPRTESGELLGLLLLPWIRSATVQWPLARLSCDSEVQCVTRVTNIGLRSRRSATRDLHLPRCPQGKQHLPSVARPMSRLILIQRSNREVDRRRSSCSLVGRYRRFGRTQRAHVQIRKLGLFLRNY